MLLAKAFLIFRSVRYVYIHIITHNTSTITQLQVSLPGLHITLGVFYRLWSLLEVACHKLDLELSKRTAPLPSDHQSYSEYSKIMQELAAKQEKKNELESYTISLNSHIPHLASLLPDPDNNPILRVLHQEASTASRKLHEMVGILYYF